MNSNNQNTFDNTGFDSQNPGRAQDDIPSTGMAGYDQQSSAIDSPSVEGGYGQQTTGRDQFSGGQSHSLGSGQHRHAGDTTGTQGFGTGNDFENRPTTDVGAGLTSTQNYGTSDEDNTQTRQPGLGDKIKGTAEVTAGKVTRNTGMVERGEERKNL
ncbi:hypothetical protein BDP27DRAFT_1404351 [Rhodocollybia butyracea]|uniref:Uncharacterized protein n=1 Tax=Rhodocollybia butyracea TaxID=206335 RepID=A0A9P5PNM9_9AGAR|nr:hypothetical protein BDP27DRAFT_1404351 [Rhodocollybia butyracea]